MITDAAPQQMEEIFRDTILCWSQARELLTVVAAPSWPTPEGIGIIPLKGSTRSSAKRYRSSQGHTRWPDLALHASPYAFMLCVLEGEADIRVGTTVAGKSTAIRARKQAVHALTLPPQSCLIVPPGVPYADGTTPHWEREYPENARSQLLWVRVTPSGAMMHLCRTIGLTHTHSSTFFVKAPQISALTQFMLENVASDDQSDTQPYDLLASYLNTILLCIARNWSSSHVIDGNNATRLDSDFAPDSSGAMDLAASSDVTLQRACRYIQSHITDAMSLEQIAQHSYTSVPQLKRIFRAGLDTSVMKYVKARRIEEAQTFLRNTDLAIEEIGIICGYPQRTHFSRVFKEQVGLPPQLFRQGEREETQ